MTDQRPETDLPAVWQVPPVDWRSVDWPQAQRVVLRVRLHYRYTYTGPVTDLRQRLVMVPPSRRGDQARLWHHLAVRGVEGPLGLRWDVDEAANPICHVLAPRVPHAVDFEARYVVERRLDAGPERVALDRTLLNRYLTPTALTAPDQRLAALALTLAAGEADPLRRAERAHDWAAGAITYQHGITGVQTPAAMALHLGRGVCQDYAHLMLCMLRLLGVPARYVSGHLLGEGAPHAWVEALVPCADAVGWADVVAYDPTHHRRVGGNYVVVAVGRDFADVTPTSGSYSGAAQGRLSASKQADVLRVEYADGGGVGEAEQEEVAA